VSGALVLYEKDPATHVARLTFNRPDKLNALVDDMYDRMGEALDDAARDDDVKVVILRGAGGTFTSGQDMSVAYGWYGSEAHPRTPGERPKRPTQRRRLTYDRYAQAIYHDLYKHNKVLLAQVEGHALGGGLEFLLACDLSVVAEGTQVGMPAARFLGPVLGNLHLFFYRLGPVLAKDLLLTGRVTDAAELAERGAFTRFVPRDSVATETEALAAQVGRMPADGIAIAKELFRLVQETPGMAQADVTEIIGHAFGTNLSFRSDEFNFVKIRAKLGTKKAFELRDAYFDRGEPLPDLD
jgi:enoyl-CoA hydratase/carnithine racemase